jgi:hypothetical protein
MALGRRQLADVLPHRLDPPPAATVGTTPPAALVAAPGQVESRKPAYCCSSRRPLASDGGSEAVQRADLESALGPPGPPLGAVSAAPPTPNKALPNPGAEHRSDQPAEGSGPASGPDSKSSAEAGPVVGRTLITVCADARLRVLPGQDREARAWWVRGQASIGPKRNRAGHCRSGGPHK